MNQEVQTRIENEKKEYILYASRSREIQKEEEKMFYKKYNKTVEDKDFNNFIKRSKKNLKV